MYFSERKKEHEDHISIVAIAAGILFAALFLLFSCEKPEKPVYDNPYDPLNEDFVTPEAIILTGPSDGSVVDQTTVTFVWTGSYDQGIYSYMLRGFDNVFSQWQSGLYSATYQYLDEGTYTFMVKEAQNENIVQEIPDSVVFTVDAVTSCALVLRRWHLDAVNGAPFSVYLDIENATGIMGLSAVVEFPGDKCILQGIDEVAGGLQGTDGILLLSSLPADANSSGTVTIDAVSLGTGSGFSGNATLCRMNFLSQSSQNYSISINLTSSKMRDPENNPVSINRVRGSVVN